MRETAREPARKPGYDITEAKRSMFKKEWSAVSGASERPKEEN